MAGLGRRTHYRKHLTDAVLHDLPEPNPPHSRIAKIVATRGSNQFDVLLAAVEQDQTHSSSNGDNNDGNNNTPTKQSTTELAILPTKFRKLVWLKRNDYVIVETVTDDDDKDDKTDDTDNPPEDNNNKKPDSSSVNNGIRCMISHILYQEQIKHLVSRGMWPQHDPQFALDDKKWQQQQYSIASDGGSSSPRVNDDGIVYQESYFPTDGDNNGDHVGDNEDGEDPLMVADDPLMFVNTNRLARMTVQDSSSDEEDEED